MCESEGIGQRLDCWDMFVDVTSGMLRDSRLQDAKTWLVHRLKEADTYKSAASLALALGGGALVVSWAEASHPVSAWLIWDYVILWAYQALLCIACLSTGHAIVRKLLRIELSGLESLVVSMATGVVAFVLLMYAGGAIRLFGPTFSILLPVAMTLVSAPGFWVWWRGEYSGPETARPLSRLGLMAWGFGIVSAALVYLQAATPDSIAYDAAWSHLTVAEDYAREGGIVPFYTNTPKNLPHLASILYTWSFQLPGLNHPALHWMCAQHTELLLFGWTLAGVAAAVRWALPEHGVRGTWAAVFLFPAIYVYDSNLGAAADHVAAFFAIPFLLVSMRAGEAFRPQLVLLSGALAGALLHTKFQSSYLIAPVGGFLALRWLWLWYRRFRLKAGGATPEASARDLLVAPVLHVAMALLVFGPHLLKNWLFYHNPLYPLLLSTFDSHPYIEGFPFDPMQEATTSLGLFERIEKASLLSFTFSFNPQYTFIGRVPVFGSLFTFLSPLALLFWRKRRVLGIFLLGQVAVFVWAFVYPIDRNLQLILPWLAAYTATAIVGAWQWGKLARLGVGLLVVLQIGWGARFMIAGGEPRVHSFISLFKQDLAKASEKTRYDRFRPQYLALSRALPEDAVVLLHTHHGHLGIQRRTVVDWAGWQYAIDYRKMKTPRDVFLRFRELGITHIAWNNRDFPAMKQEDALFMAFTRGYAKRSSTPGFSIWEMPAEPPPETEPLSILALGLHGYENGLYGVTDMGIVEEGGSWVKATFPRPRTRVGQARFSALLDEADVVFWTPAFELKRPQEVQLNRCFKREHRYYGGYRVPYYVVYLRRSSCPVGSRSGSD